MVRFLVLRIQLEVNYIVEHFSENCPMEMWTSTSDMALFRKYATSIVNVDLTYYKHSIDHQISSIAIPYDAFLRLLRKKALDGKWKCMKNQTEVSP